MKPEIFSDHVISWLNTYFKDEGLEIYYDQIGQLNFSINRRALTIESGGIGASGKWSKATVSYATLAEVDWKAVDELKQKVLNEIQSN